MYRLPVDFRKRQSGQALLLILLVLAVVLTMVLSSVSKSVTDVGISEYEDDSIRAFDAAQAGIENIVVGQASSGETVSLDNDTSFTATSGNLQRSGNFIRYPVELFSGESALFWFVDHQYIDSNGDGENDEYVIRCPDGDCTTGKIPSQLVICWGGVGTATDVSETPAVYAEFYYSTVNKR